MKRLLLLVALMPMLLNAQNDARYLEGAVPVVDGKVVFTKRIEVPQTAADQLYDGLLDWANQRFNSDEARVAYTNKEAGEIAVVAKEYLVFTSTALSLDRSMMSYRLTIECEGYQALLTISQIRYSYDVTYKRQPERYEAETHITDEYALHKGKLNRMTGKFRRKTIDLVDDIFNSAAAALGVRLLGETAQQSNVVKTTPTSPVVLQQETITVAAPEKTVTAPAASTYHPGEGFVAMEAGNIPSTLLAMLPDSRLTVALLNGTNAEKEAEWKGKGNMMGKTIATIAVKKESAIAASLNDNDSYLISFAQADGGAGDWMIMECRKQGETTEGNNSVIIGEILRVWVK